MGKTTPHCDVGPVHLRMRDTRRGWAALALACERALKGGLASITVTPRLCGWELIYGSVDVMTGGAFYPLTDDEHARLRESFADRIVLVAWEYGLDVAFADHPAPGPQFDIVGAVRVRPLGFASLLPGWLRRRARSSGPPIQPADLSAN
jgi:hypothetical protein